MNCVLGVQSESSVDNFKAPVLLSGITIEEYPLQPKPFSVFFYIIGLNQS